MSEDTHLRLKLKNAEVTGQEYITPDHFYLECRCPHCKGPQWHSPGAAECIYCGKDMNVGHLKIVKTATKAPGEDPGPDVA